jgi:peptide/nickel transport system permease protein
VSGSRRPRPHASHPPDASKVELGYDPLGGGDPRRRASRIGTRARVRRIRGQLALALVQFRRDRMARIGALAMGCLMMVAIFADVLASELPVVCRFHGAVYILPNVTHPAALAGYDVARLEDERAPGDWALRPLVPYGSNQTSTHGRLETMQPPSIVGSHPLGTDAFGRDVFSRIVHGARTSLGAAMLATLGFVALGTTLGALAGFFGGALDAIVARVIEALTAFPTLVLVLVVQAVLARPTMFTLMLAIGLTRWPEVARLVRAEVLLVSSQDYVVAARALGATPLRVLRKHVVPNAFAPILVAATFGVASVILIEASLDFLRVGIPPSAASWGETLSETREHLGAWWLLVFPGLAVFVTVMALNLVGEALRDALDPRLRAAVGGVAETTTDPRGRPGGEPMPPSSAAFDETTHA